MVRAWILKEKNNDKDMQAAVLPQKVSQLLLEMNL
jgi:hypothetical protein